MDAKEKNRLAGILLLAHGGLMGVIYLLMTVFFGIILYADPNAPTFIFIIMSIFISISFAIFVLPQIIGGWKMYKEKPDAKNWGIAAAIVACLSGFLGIGAGVFAMIFLFGEDGKSFYNSLSGGNYLNPANPVDDFKYRDYQQQSREPHSWK